MASRRQRKNMIDSVCLEGVTFEDPIQIKQAVVRHFKHQFSESWTIRPKLSGPFNVIGPEAAAKLEEEFSTDEIWAAIKDCDGCKAPGTDDFNLECIKKCWPVMKNKIISMIQEFHTNAKLSCGINSSSLVLIPKKDNPLGLGDYRPISLVSSIYKILAKILSRRIKKVLLAVINEVQPAFVSGRHILDEVMIANEVVDEWHKAKKKGIILKLDFEKAYNSVNWVFLLSMLGNLGFGTRWIRWIKTCITSAKVSILVNGAPTEEFVPQKGLRQGDPLSSFLFLVAAEGLNLLLSRAFEKGLIKDASVGSEQLGISHLQFADDTIIFCEGELEEVMNIKRVLRCFEVLSGLRINYHKSVVCGVGIQEEQTKVFAEALNCISKKLPFNFLGLPLGANLRQRSTWSPVMDKIQKKLTSWKRKLMSFVGRLTLIKSALSNLPTYFLSIFKMPKGAVNTISKLQANFLWGGSDSSRKVHLVKWREVTNSKNQGGLGVRDLGEVNVSMLLKWWWKYSSEDKALWKSMVCSRYGRIGGGWFPPMNHPVGVSVVWKGISQLTAAN
ncbi:hypothetical protein CsSME_00046588 [Camellia sinensis var. sinensis]